MSKREGKERKREKVKMTNQQLIQQLIQTNVAFIHHDATMDDAVKKMVALQISSLLVYDHEDRVVGILTERDVVRKFTLLILQDKMSRTVSTVMTRPLVCASAGNFNEEIPRLHAELGIRHFPIVRGDLVARGAPLVLVSDIVGLVSTTDLAREYLNRLATKQQEPSTPRLPVALTVICRNRSEGNFYQNIFEQLNFKVAVETAISEEIAKNFRAESRILIEFDTFPAAEQKIILEGLKSWPGRMVIATSREELLPVFRKHLNRQDSRSHHAHGHPSHEQHQQVALKPLNLPYCARLFG